MTELEPYVEQEIVEVGAIPAGLFGTSDPREVVERASATADALLEVVHSKGLIKKMGKSGGEHVLVEAWTLLGSMLGVFPVVVWTRKLEDGWEARVEAKTLAGAVVGAAEAQCLRAEKNWKNRDDFTLRSMAQTRAVSKAMRAPLGFIIQLAGLNPTPAEEMPEFSESGAVAAPAADGAVEGGGAPGGGGAAAAAPVPSPDLEVPFGPHKGTRVGDLPEDYLRWLAGEVVEPDDSTTDEQPKPGFEPDDETTLILQQSAQETLAKLEKAKAITNLGAVFENLQEHGSLPPGHDDWAAYLRWYIEGRYEIDLGKVNWRQALTTQQIRETTAYMMEMEIPL